MLLMKPPEAVDALDGLLEGTVDLACVGERIGNELGLGIRDRLRLCSS